MADGTEIEQASSGASLVFPIRAGEVKKGMHVMIKGHPCKVVEVTTSKTGKHGHAKANITALDVFTGKKLEDISPTSHNMVAPVVNRTDYALVDINDEGFASLMTEEGDMKEDLEVPGTEDYAKLREAFQAAMDEGKDFYVGVLSAPDNEKATVPKEMILPDGYKAL